MTMRTTTALCATLAAMLLAAPAIEAQVITPVGATATSRFSDTFFTPTDDIRPERLIDGSGLIDDAGTPGDVLDDLHDFDENGATMWHGGCTDAGIAGGIDTAACDADEFTEPVVDDQILEFDLGGLFGVVEAHVWQMNQGGAFGALAPDRGVDEFEILVSTDGSSFSSVGTFNLATSPGTANLAAQVFALDEVPIEATHVRFNINTEHNSGGSPDGTEFVGLSEVRFTGEEIVSVLKGDSNGDGVVNTLDIDPFVQALTDPAGYMAAFPAVDFLGANDINMDGVVSTLDIDAFVAIITGPAAATPEPTSLALIGCGAAFATVRRRK